MKSNNKKQSIVKSINRVFDLSSSDLRVLSVIIGAVLILAMAQQLFFNPTFEETNGQGIILKQDRKLNINTAPYKTLQELPGIGPALARRILEYRETHGKFSEVEDIMKIKGIGPKTYAMLKERITLGEN